MSFQFEDYEEDSFVSSLSSSFASSFVSSNLKRGKEHPRVDRG